MNRNFDYLECEVIRQALRMMIYEFRGRITNNDYEDIPEMKKRYEKDIETAQNLLNDFYKHL